MNVERNLIAGSVATALVVVVLLVVVGRGEAVRMAQETWSQQGTAIARGARLYDDYCANCHGARGEGVAGTGPPLNVEDLWAGRKGLAFYGNLHDYIALTTAGGHSRRDMPVWSSQYGGLLRDDQIENVTLFILNWMGPQPEGVRSAPPLVGQAGDPAQGEATFARNCAKCHGSTAGGTLAAPSLVSSEMAGRSNDFFRKTIRDGIPGTPMVPWAWDEVLAPQDVENVIAFLRSRQ